LGVVGRMLEAKKNAAKKAEQDSRYKEVSRRSENSLYSSNTAAFLCDNLMKSVPKNEKSPQALLPC
jgi:hypothetical protein